MARSSSATSIVAFIAQTVLSDVPGDHRQKHPENRPPRLAVELDNPAVVADYLGH
jgi:hypothetical protein